MQAFIDKTDISDVLIERPISFSIKDRHYSVYPATLGKIQLIARLIEVIGINNADANSPDSLFKGAREAAEKHREESIRLIAYSTLPNAECLDENKVQARIKELKVADEKDVTLLLITIMSQDKTEAVMKHFGIDKETQRMDRVLKVKDKDKSTLTFFGKSIWGALIDHACERYGWSYQYVLWGISYSCLQLLMADHIKTVYLTDEERKRAGVPNDGLVIRIEEKGTLENFIKNQSWK